jgi:hypothetical protein
MQMVFMRMITSCFSFTGLSPSHLDNKSTRMKASMISHSAGIIEDCITRLNPSHAHHVESLLASCFPTTDTYSWGGPLGYTDERLKGYLNLVVPDFLTNDTKIAIGKLENEALYATLLVEPFGAVESDMDKVAYDDSSVIDFLLAICRKAFIRGFQSRERTVSDITIQNVRCGYIAWMGVNALHRRKGACLSMVVHATGLLKAQGYNYSVAYCTSPKSKYVFLKADYELWGEIVYADFEFNGECPYKHVPDAVSIMVKRL